MPVLELAPDEKTERFLVQELTVSGTALSAFKLPHSEAADVDMELVQSGVAAVVGELGLQLQLIPLDGLAADRAGGTDTRPAPGTVRSPGW